MALLQMQLTALNIAAGTATLTARANKVQDNEVAGITTLTVAAGANTLRPVTWTLNAFYDVEIEQSYQ